MRKLTLREKRVVLLGAALVGLYVLAFGGLRLWRALELRRSEYAQLVREAQNLGLEIKTYQAKADSVQKLMDDFKLDPAKLNRSTAVAEASAAIQKAAAAAGIQVGPVRESAGRSANKELATVQLEGTGPVPAVTALLSRLQSVGYPLVIESVQLTPMPMGPAMLKFNLTLVILDFEQWKKGGVGNA
jgi:hypothetical protein